MECAWDRSFIICVTPASITLQSQEANGTIDAYDWSVSVNEGTE